MKETIKFEYIFAIIVTVILAVSLFVFKDNKDVTIPVITCLIGSLSAITAFFFTKSVPK